MNENPYESPLTESKSPKRKGMSRLVFWLSCLGLIGMVVVCLLPNVRIGRQAPRRASCANNLKHIGIALHNYHEQYHAFPPAYTVDANGKRLHSWRTLILPFIEQATLYEQIDLSKPWDDPANRVAYEQRIPAYQCPSVSIPEGHTTYLVVVAPNGCFVGEQSRSFSDISDGTSNTLAVIEFDAEHAVHWMSPQDATQEMVLNFAAAAHLPHPGGAQALFADAHIQFLPATTKPELLRAIISIDGKEDIADELKW